ncbi:formate dehydrogenase accessory protein FdhE [Erwinia tracheiphila]|uniref:Protein FdhE homolog n=1 Tax=Erwinia tracheiphila TaxID=65700 RepID=A0A345CW76_9GAMM|nr:formate dehydrogenase accessory protein FdhE [Erwinia tracheiphila]AXF77693.1 formate dehydrogenase accessory protein FdhE [Erwinia tracheiphila]UIA83621.1 formate dehydrogenase accessory protein FdhE [Erwinia tracheiphila]UIA92206.1 formate dehydrogenase accessory protein FdhE [Erwinia tracheiphila]
MNKHLTPQAPLENGGQNGAERVPPLLFPRLKNLYSRRAARLRQLAEKNPLGDYLRFVAVIATAQEIVLYDYPLHTDIHRKKNAAQGRPPLDMHSLARDMHWQRLLHSLIAELKPEMTGQALAVLENLEKVSAQELEAIASSLLAGNFGEISSDKSPFVWAALSLWWAQMATLLPGKIDVAFGTEHRFCPVCASVAVSAVQHMTTQKEGVRYLHCNLCESEWHVAHAGCSYCDQGGELHRWSLGNEMEAIKAESCGDCGTYMKILLQEKNPAVEPIADDLASLILDVRMEQEGFTRSGLNPFLFPGK